MSGRRPPHGRSSDSLVSTPPEHRLHFHGDDGATGASANLVDNTALASLSSCISRSDTVVSSMSSMVQPSEYIGTTSRREETLTKSDVSSPPATIMAGTSPPLRGSREAYADDSGNTNGATQYGSVAAQPRQLYQDSDGLYYYQYYESPDPASDPVYAHGSKAACYDSAAETQGHGQRLSSHSALLINNSGLSKSSTNNSEYKRGSYSQIVDADNAGSPPLGPGRTSVERKLAGHARWHSWWGMFLFGLFGVASAIGHHVWYQSLDGKRAERQLEYVRYGTLLAFAAKAGLTASVVTAYRLRVWTTVRTRLMSVRAIDSMFAATEDVTAFFNWEFISRAKTVAALVAFVWLSPLVVILTANTLMVEMRPTEHAARCPNIRTLNFDLEETNDFRNPQIVDQVRSMSLSFYNSTQQNPKDVSGWFDYWTGPSPKLEQAVTIPAFMESVSVRKNASIDVCSEGWNCVYNISFVGPGYKCTEVASGVGQAPRALTMSSGFQASAPFDTSILLPRGNFSYYAFNTGGEYSKMQMKEVYGGGRPVGNFTNAKNETVYPKNLGAFRTDPVIWIGHAQVVNPDRQMPANPQDPEWDKAFVPKIFACEHQETRYTVMFNHTGGVQNTTVLERSFLGPTINTTFVPKVDARDGTNDNTTARPEKNYVMPQDIGRYRRTAAYYGMGQKLRAFLNGTVAISGTPEKWITSTNANTKAMQTKLLEKRLFMPRNNLMELVQSLYEDMVLSLFSDPQLNVVAWAKKPAEASGVMTSQKAAALTGTDPETYEMECVRSKKENVFVYRRADLWAVYGVGISLAMLGVAAGLWAVVWEERQGGRIARNTRFSSIVAATRGPALDGVAWWAVDRGRVPKDVMAARMGFGLLPSEYRRRQAGVASVATTPGMTPSRHFSADMWSQPDRRTSGYLSKRTASPTASLRRRGRDPLMYGFGLEGEVEQPTTKLPKF